MAKTKLRPDNARTAGQLQRMKILAKGKIGCFFCNNNYLKLGASKAIYESKHWYIKKNVYPYAGTRYHYLIVPKVHVTKVTEISSKVWSEFLKMAIWTEKYLGVKGYSILARNGDMKYTGATLDHLHFHFVSGGPKKKGGKLKDNVRFTLAHKSIRPQRS